MDGSQTLGLRRPPPGAPAPRFKAVTNVNDQFAFDTVAGRYVVMAFVGSAGGDHATAALERIAANVALFDTTNRVFFWVTCDPQDRALGRLADQTGIQVFWDFDFAISNGWGVSEPEFPGKYIPTLFILDPQLRVVVARPLAEIDELLNDLAQLPEPALHAGFAVPAPVLVLPRVFEPALCEGLIDYYRASEPYDSGFMRQVGDKTVLIKDYVHKRRRDVTLDNQDLIAATRMRLANRLAPEVQRAFQFNATRIERYIVACYLADEQAHFKPHRDNTTAGTAHRRFAVTINLNSDYEGGDLSFPEFGSQTYRAPPGGAVVFSCSLLHEVKPMVRGTRFAFLPFLYDDAAAAVRQANLGALEETLRPVQDD